VLTAVLYPFLHALTRSLFPSTYADYYHLCLCLLLCHSWKDWAKAGLLRFCGDLYAILPVLAAYIICGRTCLPACH